MPRKNLKNKPLIEAILEIKWKLASRLPVEGAEGATSQVTVLGTDPHYKLLLGRLFDRLAKEYPVHEPLPTANLPDEVVGHLVQHRFRATKDGWPLVQLGPGIFTVNETEEYTWCGFEKRATDAVVKLFEAHPNVAEMETQSVVLRYIDAVEFDYRAENAFVFLREQLKVTLGLPDTLFEKTGVSKLPLNSSWQATFASNTPSGRIHLSFATGQKGDVPAILWETTFQSAGNDMPDMPDGFPAWIVAAHDITDDWFFKLIEGDLERRFDGE